MATAKEVYCMWEDIMPGWKCYLADFELLSMKDDGPAEVRKYLECIAGVLREGLEEFKAKRSVYGFFYNFTPGCKRAQILFESPLSVEFRLCRDFLKAAEDAFRFCDTPYRYRAHLQKLFRQHGKTIREVWMTKSERVKLSSFRPSNPILVWRGYQLPYAEDGMSWSLSKAVATRIAQEGERNGGQPMLLTGIVDPSTSWPT
jgi:hypothetical protein